MLGANHKILAAARRDILSPEFKKAADEIDPEGVTMMEIRKFVIDIPHKPSRISHGYFCINQIEYEHHTPYVLIIYCKYNKIDTIDRDNVGCASIRLSEFNPIPNLNLAKLFCQLPLFTKEMSGILQKHGFTKESSNTINTIIHKECYRLFKEIVDQIECNIIKVSVKK